MKKRFLLSFAVFLLLTVHLHAQNQGLANTSKSKFSVLKPVGLGEVEWTTGFWADRFRVCRETMVPSILDQYMNPGLTHAFRNFEIAAGLEKGVHEGPPFHDGDFYKVLEAVSAVYANTKDPQLLQKLEDIIPVIAKAQRADGYIFTPVAIEERNHPEKARAFQDRLHFESYNIGHLMTAACIHYRATGKTNLLDIAKKATDYLYNFYRKSSPELARNAICPSHYMGVVEMYRTTADPRYLELAKSLIDIRGLVDDGTDDNQDRIPFRQQKKAVGHAVRANYLYAGAADVYAETGEDSLLTTLNLLWNDVANRKLYITGACGALYNGVSPDGTTYQPTEIQQVQQAYGRDYQLPNFTAHNETCANIGNLLWNWRMLQITGKARYADMLELSLYNSILSGISLDGTKFLYANPLAVSDNMPFSQRWSKDRVEYINISNCCPPNTVRTIAEVSNYAYSLGKNALYVNLYGANNLSTTLDNGSKISVTQQTNYPWEGNIILNIQEIPSASFSLFLRMPGWVDKPEVLINGRTGLTKLVAGEYAEFKRSWKKGDRIEIRLPMPAKLMQANPLVEETRNQVAVKRGPIVYCLESVDLRSGEKVIDMGLSSTATLKPVNFRIGTTEVVALEGQANQLGESRFANQLYHEVSPGFTKKTNIRLVPYYAWGNRGHTDMQVWLPLQR